MVSCFLIDTIKIWLTVENCFGNHLTIILFVLITRISMGLLNVDLRVLCMEKGWIELYCNICHVWIASQMILVDNLKKELYVLVKISDCIVKNYCYYRSRWIFHILTCRLVHFSNEDLFCAYRQLEKSWRSFLRIFFNFSCLLFNFVWNWGKNTL